MYHKYQECCGKMYRYLSTTGYRCTMSCVAVAWLGIHTCGVVSNCFFPRHVDIEEPEDYPGLLSVVMNTKSLTRAQL